MEDKKLEGKIQEVATPFGITKIYKPKSEKKFAKAIVEYEKKEIANQYKWGVLCLKDNQDEDALYGNSRKKK